MYSLSTAFVAVSALTSVVSAQYSPFFLDFVYTKQPNGNPDGQTNTYAIEFNVSSTNSGNQSAYCYTIWGDNSAFSGDAYSDNVPTGSWIQCAAGEAQSEIDNFNSEFAFQLFPYFEIGNFTLAIQQNITQFVNGVGSVIILESDVTNPYRITNATSEFTCDIDPIEVKYEQHASGDCTTGANFTGYTIPVATETTGAPCNVEVDFYVLQTTAYGDNIFVVGNITELGNWNPYDGVALSASQYSASLPNWQGSVEIPAGTVFEFKYIEWAINATLIWETGDNRVFTVHSDTCASQEVGDDTFRN